MASLFGGSQSKSKPVDTAPTAFKQLRNPLAELFGGLIGIPQGQAFGPEGQQYLSGGPAGNQALGGLPQFGGQFTAPLGGAEQNILTGLQGEGAGRQDYLAQVLSGQFLQPGAGNPFLQQFADAANRQTMQQYEEILGRTLPGQFTQAGQQVQPGGSSAFDRAAAIQSRGLAQALSDTNAKIFGQAYEAERGRQQEATQLSQQEVDTTIKNLQAQALPRLIEQHGLDQGLAEFQRQTQMLIQVLSILQGVTAPALGTESKAEEKPNIVGTLMGPAGVAVGGLGAGGFFGGGGAAGAGGP